MIILIFLGDLLLMSTLRKVHASRRTECMQRLQTVLQSAMYVFYFFCCISFVGIKVAEVRLAVRL